MANTANLTSVRNLGVASLWITVICLEDVLKVPKGIILPFDPFKTSSQSGITQLSQARRGAV